MNRRNARNAAQKAAKQAKKDEKESGKQPEAVAGAAASSAPSSSASTSGAMLSGLSGTRLTSAIAHGPGPWNPPAQSPAQSTTGQPNLPARARAARSALEDILNDAGMSDADFCSCCGNMLGTYKFAAGELGEGHLPVVVSGLPSGLAEKLSGKGPAASTAAAATAAAGSRPSSIFPPGFPNNMTSTVKAAINARNAPGVTMDDYIDMAMNEAAGLAERHKNAENKPEGYDDTTYLAAMKAIREVTNNGTQRSMSMKKFIDFVKKPEVKAFFEEELAKENEGRCKDCYVTFDDDEDENEKQQSDGDGIKGKAKAMGSGKGKGNEVETKAKVKAESKGKGREVIKNEGETKANEIVIKEVSEGMEEMGMDETEQGTSGGKGKNNERVKERRKKYKAKKRQQKKDQKKEAQEKEAQEKEAQQKDVQQKEAQQEDAQQKKDHQKEAQQEDAQQKKDHQKEDQEKNEMSGQQGTGTVDQSTQTDDFDWLVEFVSNAVMACSKRAEQPTHQGQQSARAGCQHLHDDCSFRDYYAAHFCTNCHKYHPSIHEDDNDDDDDDDDGSDNDGNNNNNNDNDNDNDSNGNTNDDDDDSDDLDLDHTKYIRSLKRKSKRLNTEAKNEMASSPTLKDVFFPPISRKLWAAARYDRRAEWLSWNKEKWCGVMEYDAKPARAI